MKNIKNLTHRFAQVLQFLLIITLACLGIILILILFRELIPLTQQLLSASIAKSNSKILDEIIVFFLFFEFTALVIAALRHHGHTSVEFLLELGITALIRGLLTVHNNTSEVLMTSIAIILLVAALVLYNRYYHDED